VFERFTSRARQVVVYALDEARTHERIGTEHILLGLLREREGMGARLLASFDVTAEQVRAQVIPAPGPGEGDPARPAGEDTARPGEEDAARLREVPFSSEVKMVLQHSLREALGLGHNYVGTEHLLLGLLREREGAAAKILAGYGVDHEKARDRIVVLTSARGGRVESPSEPAGEVADEA
jgi:ATP-dependent Clp protease ATP-binding subunit ClpC